MYSVESSVQIRTVETQHIIILPTNFVNLEKVILYKFFILDTYTVYDNDEYNDMN